MQKIITYWDTILHFDRHIFPKLQNLAFKISETFWHETEPVLHFMLECVKYFSIKYEDGFENGLLGMW